MGSKCGSCSDYNGDPRDVKKYSRKNSNQIIVNGIKRPSRILESQ